MVGDYSRALDSSVDNPPLVSAWALTLMYRTSEAVALLRQLEQRPAPTILRQFVIAARTLLEDGPAAARDATDCLTRMWRLRDPSCRYYLARYLARVGRTDHALATLRGSVEGGFTCAAFLARDPWLDSLRATRQFRAILDDAASRQRTAARVFVEAGGERLLGLVPALTDASSTGADSASAAPFTRSRRDRLDWLRKRIKAGPEPVVRALMSPLRTLSRQEGAV